MKKIILLSIGILLGGLTVLAVKGNKMQEISTEIEIAAPPEKVWSVLMDFNNWHSWSPIINASKGEASVGNKLDMTMMGKEQGKDGPRYSPVIKEMDEPRFFRWRAHMMAGFIFTNDKVFELQATATGTKLVHKEMFKGLMAPIMCGQMEKGVPPMLNKMNQALKEFVESH